MTQAAAIHRHIHSIVLRRILTLFRFECAVDYKGEMKRTVSI